MLPTLAGAEITVPGDRATLRWNPASGPVTGYEVRVSRNGAEANAEALVGTPEFTIVASAGEVVQVSVRAFSMPVGPNMPVVWGPASPDSESMRFAGSTGSEQAVAVLDCSSCGRIDIRMLPDTGSTVSVAHPPGGPWDLTRIGSFVGDGTVQVALRQRNTGEMWLGDLSGSTLIRRTNHANPDFRRNLVNRAADFDGDGIDEIVVWDSNSGNIEFWGFESGQMKRLERFATMPPSLGFIGIGDIDRDGQLDLWFDSRQGDVLVVRTNQLRYASGLLVPAGTDTVPLDIADYDGDATPDVLWRRSGNGRLSVGLLRGSGSSLQMYPFDLPRKSGDDLLMPRVSFDLDGQFGAEILLQGTGSGSNAIDALAPFVNATQRQRQLVADPGSKLVQIMR